MAGQLDRVTVGRIERPFGVKGEVKVRSLSDVPGRFESLTHVSLVAKNGKRMDTSVTHVRRTGTGFIVGLAGLTTPEDAGIWREGLIQVPRGTVPALPDGQFYECDLVGLAVETEEGQPIGVLEQIWELPGNHVFVVRQGAKEILIPAVKELVAAVDLERRVMTVHMIEGLGA
ncbi:MAG: ribosome maturation factor RimM [Nitrospiraceae bacterium]